MRRSTMAAMMGGILLAGPAWADYTKSQELTILAAHSASLAAKFCPYVVNSAKMQEVLSRKHLSQADVSSGWFSDLLQTDLAADTDRYRNETAEACAQAWVSFGPNAPMRGLLRAK